MENINKLAISVDSLDARADIIAQRMLLNGADDVAFKHG